MIISKSSPRGNAFYIMGSVKKLLLDTGRKDEWPEILRRMESGNYDNLCAVAEEVTHGSIQVR